MLTGRCDNFLNGRPDLDDTIRRLVAFAEVGADVLYAPYPPDMDAVRAIVAAVAPKPVNVVVGPADARPPVAELLAAGVRRISLGGALYLKAMGALRDAVGELAAGNLAGATGGMTGAEAAALVSPTPAAG